MGKATDFESTVSHSDGTATQRDTYQPDSRSVEQTRYASTSTLNRANDDAEESEIASPKQESYGRVY